MELSFVTPSYPLTGIGFGCASHGMVGCPEPTEKNIRSFSHDLRGLSITGSYEDCLAALPEWTPQAALVLFGNAGGENGFLSRLGEKLSCPMTGGAAAIDTVTGRKGLIAGGGEAAIFLVRDDRYDVTVESRNIHETLMGEWELGFRDPRVLETVNGKDALCWYTEKRRELGLRETDFEHLTFSDKYGINAHLSLSGGKLVSGRDLEHCMTLRYVEPGKVRERMQAFYGDKDAIVFGCAGLKGILEGPLEAEGLGLFMFGEVCTLCGKREFGNLMLSKLRAVPKES